MHVGVADFVKGAFSNRMVPNYLSSYLSVCLFIDLGQQNQKVNFALKPRPANAKPNPYIRNS